MIFRSMNRRESRIIGRMRLQEECYGESLDSNCFHIYLNTTPTYCQACHTYHSHWDKRSQPVMTIYGNRYMGNSCFGFFCYLPHWHIDRPIFPQHLPKIDFSWFLRERHIPILLQLAGDTVCCSFDLTNLYIGLYRYGLRRQRESLRTAKNQDCSSTFLLHRSIYYFLRNNSHFWSLRFFSASV